jgi:hypothetical protein
VTYLDAAGFAGRTLIERMHAYFPALGAVSLPGASLWALEQRNTLRDDRGRHLICSLDLNVVRAQQLARRSAVNQLGK